jgi:transcriptional repressor NrdR
LKCPVCAFEDDRVIETRSGKDGEQIRRRRECLKCLQRYTTIESIVVGLPLVIKKDGRREEFSKEKLFHGIQSACQKRPVSLSQVEQMVDRVSLWVRSRAEPEITSKDIGGRVILELRAVDNVAYVRFASVYQEFRSIDEFVSRLASDSEPIEKNPEV